MEELHTKDLDRYLGRSVLPTSAEVTDGKGTEISAGQGEPVTYRPDRAADVPLGFWRYFVESKSARRGRVRDALRMPFVENFWWRFGWALLFAFATFAVAFAGIVFHQVRDLRRQVAQQRILYRDLVGPRTSSADIEFQMSNLSRRVEQSDRRVSELQNHVLRMEQRLAEKTEAAVAAEKSASTRTEEFAEIERKLEQTRKEEIKRLLDAERRALSEVEHKLEQARQQEVKPLHEAAGR